ncbi:hypothetical protein PanWU01x14_280410 [Parasponia andersonii]|uniref:Uncharacterized protein n=1 Tax=Parasponia andersonii TaxID=3476 RepID=A0A2P5B1E7_PARAD|nr:hypothetical protein PanWU01x14_280410 [Parasponia andersonii]
MAYFCTVPAATLQVSVTFINGFWDSFYVMLARKVMWGRKGSLFTVREGFQTLFRESWLSE